MAEKKNPHIPSADDVRDLSNYIKTRPDKKEKISTLSFVVDIMRYGLDDAYFKLTGKHNMAKEEERYTYLVQTVAQKLGADPAEIADKDTRTPEQEEALREAERQDQVDRFDAFQQSSYMQARKALGISGRVEISEDVVYQSEGPRRSLNVKQVAVLYYFALHDEKNPILPASLTESDLEEVQALYDRLLKFIDSYTNGDKTNVQAASAALEAFIEQDMPEKSAHKAAELAGAIMQVGGRQAAITDKKFQHALTTKKNDSAYIEVYKDDFINLLTFKNGALNILESDTGGKEITSGLQSDQSIDTALLREVYTAIYQTATHIDAHTVTIYLPSFCREMGIDIQSKKAVNIFDKFQQFNKCLGVLDGNKRLKVLDVIGFDIAANTITIAAPYMNRILFDIMEKNEKTKKNGEKYLNPAHHFLMHSTIVSERNKPAIEIANRIITGIMQRGTTPDAKLPQNKNLNLADNNIDDTQVTYRVSFQEIIDSIPQLQSRLQKTDKKGKASSTNQANMQLKRAFEGAYRILKQKTDVYQYYLYLDIPKTTPTATTLKDLLVITHNGKNADYR